MIHVIPLSITVRAPFTVRGNLVGHFGVDSPLFRTAAGKLAVPGTLVIGKLAEAFQHIADLGGETASYFKSDLVNLFAASSQRGKDEHEQTNGRELRRRVTASDFIAAESTKIKNSVRTRIAIDNVSQTVADGMLQVLEQATEPGETMVFEGELRVAGKDGAAAEERILRACNWILQIGGLRTVGYGEVVSIKRSDKSAAPVAALGSPSPSGPIGLRLSFRDAFCVGEKRNDANTFTSAAIVSGAAIKGAIANQILAHHTLEGFLSNHANTFPEPIATLARNFSDIRFRHAFPIQKAKSASRNGPLPLSLALAESTRVDRAGERFDGRPVLINDMAPKPMDDWKDEAKGEANTHFGISQPDIDFRMRTQIDPEHRAAMESRLFAIEYRRNDTHDFVMAVDIPADVDRDKVIAALKQVFEKGLAGIGRGGACCDMTFCDLPQADISTSHIMMLKTPALLRVPDPGHFPQLHDFYEAAFNEIGLKGTGFRLKTLYVDEELAGHAFLQNRRDKNERDYLPFLLAKPGSVFVFEHDDPSAQLPAGWFEKGLAVPGTVLAFHGLETETDLWQVCPYVPENGYGEVVRYTPEPFGGSIGIVDVLDEEIA